MNIRKIAVTGLMSLSFSAPLKAQKSFYTMSEVGITGEIAKELSYFGGIHAGLQKNKNTTDIYAGLIVNPKKQPIFEAVLDNEYSWTKNLSSWIRETLHISKKEKELASEIAPIKFNVPVKKFDFSVAPVYNLQHDFSEREIKQGVSALVNATYSINSNNSVQFEAIYSSKPVNNLFKTTFGKFKDNTSFMISYLRKL